MSGKHCDLSDEKNWYSFPPMDYPPDTEFLPAGSEFLSGDTPVVFFTAGMEPRHVGRIPSNQLLSSFSSRHLSWFHVNMLPAKKREAALNCLKQLSSQ